MNKKDKTRLREFTFIGVPALWVFLVFFLNMDIWKAAGLVAAVLAVFALINMDKGDEDEKNINKKRTKTDN